ncbi:MAG: hypothetical protein GWO16_14710 [Gammaproteobacteria bacterium]|nr:hypothetical protein [Gammaproteobacteria bacterium]NIR99185.1 hypothetical protein [Gammaproteobacteria bacterium]NIT64809.1 hypothetical protein [Gammaproteobacteria bacterium]NIV21771.1 hypothetical protein [Gammaproteobacteria bacterium]NIX10784.1 hypothetical protein [Gammaproteobacteria bacterium]
MRALASYILRGPLQAVVIAAVLAVLSPVLPLLAYPSGAVVALVALQVGARQAVTVMAGACFAVAVAGGLLLPVGFANAAVLAVAFGLIFWLPTWLLAALLRRTGSLALAFQAAAAIGAAVVLAAFAIAGDPAAAWRSTMEAIRPELERAELLTSPAQFEQLVAFAPVITGTMAAFAVLGMILSLLIARSLQALLHNPGGLRAEFNRLRYDKVTAIAALVILAGALLTGSALAANLAIVMVLLYTFHGLAVIHGVVAGTGIASGWLAALYVLIALALLVPQTGILPHLMVVLALLGLVDTWWDLRARLPKTGA